MYALVPDKTVRFAPATEAYVGRQTIAGLSAGGKRRKRLKLACQKKVEGNGARYD